MDRVRATRIGILALTFLAASALATPAEAAWSLVWSDEFNGSSLNTGDWNYDTGTGCPTLCGWGNNELQYYRSQNVTVTGGNLVITAKAESFGGSSFTSGKIHTRNKQSFLYGRVEMRAKIPTGGGMWPAFWMMPESDVYGGWAASGEIDIMEASNATTSVGGALHFGGAWPANASTAGSYSLGGANFADSFHIYAVEWEPDAIRWYVDGVLFMTRTSAQWYSSAAPGNPLAPFDQDFYIILNTAVGGNYTGCTTPSCISASLPQEFLVDYVRVYEDIPNLLPTVSITSPTSGSTVPSGNILITADASDADGSVATVEFYEGANYLGEDTTAPYEFTWASVPNGCYQIVARALDDLGGSAEDTADITVGAGCGQSPYPGQPFALPTLIEAEDYDLGGEGVAYEDADPTNNGGQYRPGEGVDIENCADTGGGYNLGWTAGTEWIEYSVDVPASGEYVIDARVASETTGGSFHVRFNGVDETGPVAIPVTGGWQNWTTVSATVNLTAGLQTMRFVSGSDGYNLNYFDVRSNVATGIPDGDPARGALLNPSSPNPFRSTTVISYELPQAETIQLRVYDVTGRLIRTLVRGEQAPAGPGRAVWDGRDEDGREVPRGIYFYRLDAGSRSSTQRVTVIR